LRLGSGAERRRKFERCRSASIFRTPGDYLFKCRDCKHNDGKDRTCIGDKRAIMCADCAYALPDDHEPRKYRHGQARAICALGTLLNLMIVLKFALPQTGQKYQDSLAITLGPGLGLLPHIIR
jgi:ribosomal protein S26